MDGWAASTASTASVTAASTVLALPYPSAGATSSARPARPVRPASTPADTGLGGVLPVGAPAAGTVPAETAPGGMASGGPGGWRPVWELGDDAALAPVFASMAGDLVRAAGITPMHRVLDVGAGSGNAALAAAEAGADVVACDPVSALLERGRAVADARGLSLDWLPADAQRLPFGADTFDVVLSCAGVMFAPDQAAAARELVRVCRPGGTIAVASWTADGAMGRLFALLERYAPARTDGRVAAPTAWGHPARVRALFAGGDVRRLSTHHRTARLDYGGSPAQWCTLYRAYFAPIIEAYDRIGPNPKRIAALDNALLRFATDEYLGPLGGPGRYEFEYLLLLAEPR